MDPDKLAAFCAATGADPSRAHMFLAAFNGDVDAAVNSFFEDGEQMDAEAAAPTGPGPAAATVRPRSWASRVASQRRVV
jgi:UBA-like domain